jgi:PAS domain S-box-containing protein
VETNTSTHKLATLRDTHDATLNELARYKLLVDSVEDYAIFMLDPDGYIMTWNKGAEKNKGYKPEEIIGKHFSNFYMEHDIAARKPERELELARRYGRVEDEDWRVKKDGSKFWANVVITTLYDDDGTHIGFAKVTRNLTERKQHEDDLRRANATLRQQQRELETLNTSKDEFVSLASHQLRTPVTAIKQLLGILLEGYSGPVAPEHLELIRKAYQSNQRQLMIVNSLLRVAQIDAGKLILKKVPTDLMQLLDDTISDYSDSFAERGQSYEFVHEDSDAYPKLYIDSNNLRMALENLIDNASKYTPREGKITVTLKRNPDSLAISVKDTGIGIAPEDLDKLFERFSRIPNDLPNAQPGSGLGLYWAGKVIEMHQGKITVKSRPGHGTTFTVKLPVEEEIDA